MNPSQSYSTPVDKSALTITHRQARRYGLAEHVLSILVMLALLPVAIHALFYGNSQI
jgi:hypothetical protein